MKRLASFIKRAAERDVRTKVNRMSLLGEPPLAISQFAALLKTPDSSRPLEIKRKEMMRAMDSRSTYLGVVERREGSKRRKAK